jgi:hypothetical protein
MSSSLRYLSGLMLRDTILFLTCTLQVTTDKGFHILDERALKEVIDTM